MLNTNTTAKINFPNRTIAKEFVDSWTNIYSRGYTMKNNTVILENVTYHQKLFIDGYIMLENDMLSGNGII